ncbi:SwmB domain-containing protein, partial [Synechococcus sp. UW179A]|uniref:SwmB domain-containing protein n=1 Tax=Synechococcus sp. UW179A TaxID=2575510 RepID=UPI0018E0A56A
GLDIIDVSDPTNPSLKGNFNTSGYARGVTLSADGNTAFVADGYSGLQIIDVSNPASPTLTTTLDTSGVANGVTLSADSDTAFVADGRHGLDIIDVSDPTNPSLKGNFNTSSWAYGVSLSTYGNTAFVADDTSGLQIIDVSSTKYFSSNSDTAEITVIDDSRAPRLVTAETNVEGTQIILTYNEELSSATANQSDFEVSTASAANAVTAVTVDGSSVILTLNRAVTTGQQTTITYNDPTTGDDVNSIQDIVGNDAASLSGLSVANNSTVPDTIAPTLSTAETNTAGTQVILTYDEELSSATANQSDFEVTTSSATNDVADVTVDDNTVILTLTTPITTGESATVDYNDPTKGDDEYAIQDIVGNDADSLRSFPLVTISSISCEQMAAFTTQAFATLSRDQIKKIPINAIKCISKTQLSSLSPKAVKGFTKKQIAALSRHVFSAMDEPQLRKLSKKAITGLQKRQLSTLSGAELSAFKPRMLKAFPIEAISGLKPKSLDALKKRQVRAFTDDQLAGINNKRFKNTTQFVGHLSGQQLEDLSPNAVKKFTSKQIAVLRDSVFVAMGKRQLSKLSKDAVTGLQKGQLKTLDAEELSSFKPKNLSEIAPDAISGLRSESLNALNSRQARAFTDDQLAGLSKKQIKKADGFMDELSTQQKDILTIENTRQARLISDPAITLDDNFALNPAVMDPLA